MPLAHPARPAADPPKTAVPRQYDALVRPINRTLVCPIGCPSPAVRRVQIPRHGRAPARSIADGHWPEERLSTTAHAHCPRSKMARSEEHTSELQSRGHLVCRLLLEKKKTNECT